MGVGVDTITISTSEHETFSAERAILFINVTGKSYFGGQEALKKVKEVNAFVGGLIKLGMPEENIELQNIKTETNKGMVVKNASVEYVLRIECDDLDMITQISSLMTEQKHIELDRIVWKYGETETVENDMLKKCLLKSKKKAELIASVYGVELLGIRDLKENMSEEVQLIPYSDYAACAGEDYPSAVKRDYNKILESTVKHSKEMKLYITVTYRIGALKENQE